MSLPGKNNKLLGQDVLNCTELWKIGFKQRRKWEQQENNKIKNMKQQEKQILSTMCPNPALHRIITDESRERTSWAQFQTTITHLELSSEPRKHIFISNGTFGFSIISKNLTSWAHIKLHWILTRVKRNDIGALNTGHLLGHSAELICWHTRCFNVIKRPPLSN